MKDLEKIREGLLNSNILLMKDYGSTLECSFLKEGLVNKTVLVKNEILVTALRRTGVNGILEGLNFQIFKNTFDSFSLRVKARMLYHELSCSNLVSQVNSKEVVVSA